VPWKDIVKAFEYSKGNYVVLKDEDLNKAAPQSKESVDIESFVDIADISLRYFDKPYYLVPARKAEKGYVLLRETLREQNKAGLARVVIRTREYLALVAAEGQALMLFLLRYPQELIAEDEYRLPQGSLKTFRIAPRELEMSRQLVASMVSGWTPDDYRDEFRERLRSVIESRAKKGGKAVAAAEEPAQDHAAGASNVVDFMTLLKKSIAENRRTPAREKAPARKRKPKTPAKPRAKKTARTTKRKAAAIKRKAAA
jgi:DNA end-binding protein Ku